MNESHTNLEWEKISIETKALNGKAVHCLIIWDDKPPRGTGRPAPMLLDEGTRDWLLEHLPMVPFGKAIPESTKPEQHP